jgi:hypothetical protein
MAELVADAVPGVNRSLPSELEIITLLLQVRFAVL